MGSLLCRQNRSKPAELLKRRSVLEQRRMATSHIIVEAQYRRLVIKRKVVVTGSYHWCPGAWNSEPVE